MRACEGSGIGNCSSAGSGSSMIDRSIPNPSSTDARDSPQLTMASRLLLRRSRRINSLTRKAALLAYRARVQSSCRKAVFVCRSK